MKKSILSIGVKWLLVLVAVFFTSSVFAQGMDMETAPSRGPKYLWAILITLQLIAVGVVAFLKYYKSKNEAQGHSA